MERRLAAILAADVVGYSRLMGADEARTLNALRNFRGTIFEPVVADYRGRIIKRMGDGWLVEFVSIVDAVNCAIQVQEQLADHEIIKLRMGIHIGDIVHEDEDIYGDGVNIAARLQEIAAPGAIAVSDAAWRSLDGTLSARFRDQGEHDLKNIAEAVRVFVCGERSNAAIAATASRAEPLSLPDKPSIAVLPFVNMSGDQEQEYFADGITDDLITALSNVQSFFVIARNSSFVYKGQTVDTKTVAAQLGVHYVMEGSVRKAGGRIRVTAQLADAATGRQIWANHYDNTLEDVFKLQDEITASVVGAIEPRLLEVEAKRIGQKRPENLDAYDLLLRGLDLMNRLTLENTGAALRLFKAAIDIDPSYGRAYVCASWCYRRHVQVSGMTLSQHDQRESIRLARAALNVGGGDPYVFWQAGMTAALVEKDPDAGMALIDQSLLTNANANRAWIASGMVRCIVGDPETAIDHAERAIRLSPLDISMWVAHGVLATARLQLARYEECAQWARSSTRRHIYNAPAFHVLAASCAQLGLMDQAHEAVERALELDPELTCKRLEEIFLVSRYRNLDGFLEGLRKAGLPE